MGRDGRCGPTFMGTHEDIGKTDFDPLVSRQVNASYTSHTSVAPPLFGLHLALTLFVLGVLANDHDAAFALDDLALLANGLNGRSYFHLKLPPLIPLTGWSGLFGTPGDASLGQVVWRHLQCDLISRQNTDEVHPQFP